VPRSALWSYTHFVHSNEYTPQDAMAVRRAIEDCDLSRAIEIHRQIFPPLKMAFMHDTDEGDLRECLETPLPLFSFCSEAELRELRIRIAWALCLCMNPLEKALTSGMGFEWPHSMSLKATAQNFFKAIATYRNISQWKRSGKVEAVKIISSADGPCQSCKAAAREYTLDELPELPLHACENLHTVGCRCGVVATKIMGLSRRW
jgi:hypothetical protein